MANETKGMRGNTIGPGYYNHDTAENVETKEMLTKPSPELYLKIAGFIFIALDRDGKVTMANDKASEVLGCPIKEIEGKNWFDNFIPERMRVEVRSVSKRILDGDLEPVKVYENPVIAKNGAERLIHWESVYLHDDAGNITGHLSSGIDITDRMMADRKIREMAKFPEENPNPILRVSDSGVLLLSNRAGEAILENFSFSIGKEVPHFWKGLISSAYAKNETIFTEAAQVGKTYQVSLIPVTDAGYLNMYWSDITERKEAEEALRINNRMLASMNDYSEAISFAAPEKLFTTIVTKLKEITGAAEVLINDYDAENRELVLRQSTLSGEGNTKVRNILGRKLDGFRSPVTEEIYRKIMASNIGRVKSLHDASFGAISKPVGKMIEKMFGFGWFVGLALARNEQLVGTILIAGKRGSAEPGDEELLAYASTTANILARRSTEISLKKSEEFNKAIIASSKDCIKVLDMEGNLVFMSKGGQELLGISDIEPILNRSWLDFWKDDDNKNAISAFQKAKEGEVSYFEAFCPTMKGIPKWWSVVLSPILDAEGRLDNVLAISRDITERKKAENAIIESEARFRQLAENLDIVFWLTDWKEKKLLYVNPAYEKVFGMSVGSAYEDRIGWKKTIHPEDIERVDAEFQRSAATGKHLKMDYRILCDGKTKWIRERALPLTDWNGQVVRLINVAEDITEHKKAESYLVKSMRRYRLLADNSTDVVWILDLKTRKFTYFSPSVMKLRGYTPKEAMAIPLDKTMTPESYAGVIRDMEMLLEEDKVSGLDPDRTHIIETEELCKDGSTVFVEARLKFLRDGDGKPASIIGSTRDITLRKWAEDELKLLSMKLQSIADEKTLELENVHAAMIKQERLAVLGRMAASVSHELRNPLSVINNVAFYLKTRLPDLDEKSLQMLELLEKEVMRSDRIISNMLGFSRQKPNLVEDVNLNELIDSYFSSPDVKPGNIELELKLAPDLIPIKADTEKLKQILDNLVQNAFQAMPDGGTLTVATRVGTSGNAILSVKDTGCGMSAGTIAKIFEPLFSTKTTGFGLGLAIVKALVNDHGGEVKVKSKEGKGSEFTVNLPPQGVAH